MGGAADEPETRSKVEDAAAGSAVVHVIAAPQDDAITAGLVRHLHMLHVEATEPRQIGAGAVLGDALLAQVDAADAILIVVSANLHSWDRADALIGRALGRGGGGTPVVPVAGRACVWDEQPYAGIQPLPRDREPIANGNELREDALADVARGVRGLLARAGRVDPLSPFPGLEFFDEDRAADFFGRETEIEEALAKLASNLRWLQIDGPSGAGKSSFARAGLVPAIRRGSLRKGVANWAVAVMRPGYDPVTNLAETLLRPAKEGANAPLTIQGRSLGTVIRELRESPAELTSLLREGRPHGYGVLLLVDQLEEAFTLSRGDTTTVKQFDALLAAALDDRDSPLLLLTTIRSDFVVRMGEMPLLERRLSTAAARYYLGPMSEAGLQRAIERPAERAGLAFEAGLVGRIVEEARSPGALPLVANMLEALYQKRERLSLTAAAYVELGGVGGALAKRADATLNALDEDGRVRAKNLLLRLVRIGRGNEDTRLTALREEVIAAAGGTVGESVLVKLSGERTTRFGGIGEAVVRLVVVTGEEGHEQRVDLVHEALIQRWETFRTWIKEERQALELRDDVEQAARIWEASGASEDGLPKGTVLARFRAVESAGLRETAQRYLDAAEGAERRTEQEKELRQDEKRREVEQRARSQRRVILGLGASVVVLGVAFAGIAWQARIARQEARRADIAAEIAEARRIASPTRIAGVQHLRQRQLLLAAEAWKSASHAQLPFLTDVGQALGDALWNTDYITLSGHEASVLAASFSPDGSRVVTASYDGTARVWNADGTGTVIILEGHSAAIRSATFSPDGKRIVTASKDGSARVWYADGGGNIIDLRGHSASLEAAVFSADGQKVVTASADTTARVWNTTGQGEGLVLRGHSGTVRSVEFSPDGNRVLTASDDGTARIWNADGSGVAVVLRGHKEPIFEARFSHDGNRVLTASGDGTARIWNTADRGKHIILFGGTNVVLSAAFSPDGEHVATTSDNGTVRVWNSEGSGEPTILVGHSGRVTSAAFSPDGNQLVTASQDRTARIWNIGDTSEPVVLRGHQEPVWSVSFSPDGNQLVTASEDGTARIWNAHDRDSPTTLRGHQAGLLSAAFSPDGTKIVTAGEDYTARIWNADGTGTALVLFGHANAVVSAAFSPDGKRVVTSSGDKSARVWNADGTSRPLVLLGHEMWVGSAAFSPDGSRIVTGSGDKTIRVWNADGSGVALVLRGHDGWVRSVAFSPDGKRIVSSSEDKTVRVWNADGSGEPVLLRGHGGRVRSASFSPDGRLIVTASDDESARLWHADGSGEPIVLSQDEGPVLSAAFSPDGTHVATAYGDGTVRLWTIVGDRLAEAACARSNRNLTNDEWQQFFGNSPYHRTCDQWPGAPDSGIGLPSPSGTGSFSP